MAIHSSVMSLILLSMMIMSTAILPIIALMPVVKPLRKTGVLCITAVMLEVESAIIGVLVSYSLQ
ncbi:hypothetical protein ES925_11120 [Salmonella enterica]|uniref:Uncharacterized protein n=1 Tax=Salmonella enterica TaxID=28901 RepID=A0A403EXT6_SALER|nr:hypothetical protein [Salmonella enterica]EBH8098138.1 hypothetical protein [Salmonella enterica subsp. houtenae serovar O:11:g,z25:-]EAY2464976.1 hypothetical protein [Salmonella enterica]EAZ9459506.1 hypothetical protein [Salmonella enterica]EBH8126581.1 hypothetical protein [Salmonella enterica subsp. houtenae serovar O:11:g,z25:-]